MKKTVSMLCLASLAAILGGCVTRTVTVEPQHRGAIPKNTSYGSDSQGKVVDKKIVWIWQDEYRTGK